MKIMLISAPTNGAHNCEDSLSLSDVQFDTTLLRCPRVSGDLNIGVQRVKRLYQRRNMRGGNTCAVSYSQSGEAAQILAGPNAPPGPHAPPGTIG